MLLCATVVNREVCSAAVRCGLVTSHCSLYCYWTDRRHVMPAFLQLVLGFLLLFGRPFVKQFALCYWTMVCPVLSVLSVCDVGLLWPNSWMDQDATWYGGRPRSRPCVRWGPSSPQKGHSPPPNIQPMSVVTKRLDGSRCHLVRRRPRPR